jgi:hypothetical protein
MCIFEHSDVNILMLTVNILLDYDYMIIVDNVSIKCEN